jgi:cell division transport system permease protein
MSAWFSLHWHAFLLAGRRLLFNPLATLFTALVIGIALSLPAGLYTLLDNLTSLGDRISGSQQISVFLDLDAQSADIAKIQNKLKKHATVRKLRFVSRADALRSLESGAGLGDVAKSLQQNPLPDAFVIEPATGEPAALDKLREEARKWPKVAHVQLDSAWAKRLAAFADLGRQAALLLAALLGLALVVVTGNTIRLQILTQREEIEVSKLIGATSAFIRRPFLYFGAIQGLTGGLAAWLVVDGGVSLLNNNVSQLAALYASDYRLHLLNIDGGLTLLGFAALLGWLGAYLSVSLYLRKIEPR